LLLFALVWWLSLWLPMLRKLPPPALLLVVVLPARLVLVRREEASLLLPLPLSSDVSHGST
jgi:hypothetical protein